MTPLRRRMVEDMQIRNLSLNTQKPYIHKVSLFALGTSVALREGLWPRDMRTYQVHLTNEKKLAPASIAVATAALEKRLERGCRSADAQATKRRCPSS